MNLAIFGATGKVGTPLLEQALKAGHAVTVLVRSPEKLVQRGDNLIVIKGDVLNAGDVRNAVKGADAVISVIGHVKGSPDNLQADAVRNIIGAMKGEGIRRIIALTGAGVSDPQDDPQPVDRIFGLALRVMAGKVLKDSAEYVRLIKESGLEYVLARGPRLVAGELTGKYKVGYVGKGNKTMITRPDIADFLLKEAAAPTWVGKMPVVTAL